MGRPKKQTKLGITIAVRFPDTTAEKIKEGAAETGLPEAMIIRKSTEMGLPILMQALKNSGVFSPETSASAAA